METPYSAFLYDNFSISLHGISDVLDIIVLKE